jgi:glycosyltransferase involved in cell wall biosynthesis
MNSSRKKILWLASWYPNRFDPFDGDFIQRHARAAAIHHDIHVIAVKEGNIETETEVKWNFATGLTEQIIYFRPANGVFGKFQKQLKWRKLYLKAVADYVRKNGHPAVIHVHVPWKAGLIALELKKRYRISYLLSEHWGIYDPALEDNFSTKPFVFRRGIQTIMKHAQVLCLPSKYLGRCIDKTVLKKKQTLIPNVVDTSLFFYQEKKYSKFSYIHVSNMDPVKNVTGIIDAFSDLVGSRGYEDVELLLIGSRDESIRKYAERTGLLDKSIFLKGEVPYAGVAREMQLAHCFILNSKMETFSCVTVEALCCGLPVIAREVGSLPELVDASNGILIGDQDHNSLVEALIQVRENYFMYDLKAIAHTAQQKYNYGAIGDLFKNLYASA